MITIANKICRVCGKTYPACKDTTRNQRTAFRWREVACSIECGQEYFKQIEEGRGEKKKKNIRAGVKVKTEEDNGVDENKKD